MVEQIKINMLPSTHHSPPGHFLAGVIERSLIMHFLVGVAKGNGSGLLRPVLAGDYGLQGRLTLGIWRCSCFCHNDLKSFTLKDIFRAGYINIQPPSYSKFFTTSTILTVFLSTVWLLCDEYEVDSFDPILQSLLH